MKTPEEVHTFLIGRYGLRYVSVLVKRLVKYTKADISKTINGHQYNMKIREAIANDSGMSASEFFEPEFDYITGLKERVAC